MIQYVMKFGWTSMSVWWAAQQSEVLAIGTGIATVLAFFLGLSSEPEFLIVSVVREALTPTFSRF